MEGELASTLCLYDGQGKRTPRSPASPGLSELFAIKFKRWSFVRIRPSFLDFDPNCPDLVAFSAGLRGLRGFNFFFFFLKRSLLLSLPSQDRVRRCLLPQAGGAGGTVLPPRVPLRCPPALRGRDGPPAPTRSPAPLAALCGKERVVQKRFPLSGLPFSWGAQKVSRTNRPNVFYFLFFETSLPPPPPLERNKQIFPSPRRSPETSSALSSPSFPVTLQSRLK